MLLKMHLPRSRLLQPRLFAGLTRFSSTEAKTQRCGTSTEHASAGNTVGMGYTSAPIDGVSAKQVFKAMMFNIDGADRFLPVSSVTIRPALGDAAEDGGLWRSMKFHGPGPLQGKTVREHIYADTSQEQIRFVELKGPQQREANLEVVHILHKNPLCIEYFQRDRHTRERVNWDTPVQIVAKAIDATIALARAGESHAAAVDDFGGKA